MPGSDAPAGWIFKDRSFSPAELALIAEVVQTHGRLSRQELAKTICELLQWRRPNGRLKTWEAKALLAQLDRQAVVSVPALRTTKPVGSRASAPRTSRGERPVASLRAMLDEMRPVVLRAVASPADHALWRELVDRYHPRRHRVPYGAHLCWLVEVTRPEPTLVACLQVSSAVWRLAARDRCSG